MLQPPAPSKSFSSLHKPPRAVNPPPVSLQGGAIPHSLMGAGTPRRLVGVVTLHPEAEEAAEGVTLPPEAPTRAAAPPTRLAVVNSPRSQKPASENSSGRPQSALGSSLS